MRVRIQPVGEPDSLVTGWLAGDPLRPLMLMAAATSHSYAREAEVMQMCGGGEIEVEDHGNGQHSYQLLVFHEHGSETEARTHDLLIADAHPWHGILHCYLPLPGGDHVHVFSSSPVAVKLSSLEVRGTATLAQYEILHGELQRDPAPVQLPTPLLTEDGGAVLAEDGNILEPE